MKSEIGPRQLEMECAMKELAETKNKLADLGERLITVSKNLEDYSHDYSLLLEIWSAADAYCHTRRSQDYLERLLLAIHKYNTNKRI